MSDTITIVTASGAGPRGRRRGAAAPRRAAGRHQARYGYIFVAGYTLFLLAFGIIPTLYAVYLAFTKGGQFAGIDNFVKIFNDYRFLPAVGHVALYVVFWLISLLVLVTLLALVVHAVRVRWLSSASRFLFYIPGAIAGASSVLLWLFVLDPTVSPVSGLLQAMGFEKLVNVVAVENLPVIFTVIAFWAGAGGWIVIMFGALNNVPVEVMEAARIDGAGAVKTAWYIQLPMLAKWISYMGIMSLAAGTQLFVEPKVLAQATKNVVPEDYSLNQLAYLYAFRQGDFSGSAAISLLLLVVALGLSTVFIFRGRLFESD
ncbi:sugar ABC transporter permease [Microbacterium sp. 2FI]|uniref:carbohydrate ABC transporter permease n=1 Tax=Microbacterium sp. 2FI TaxID=2502193 RepID=UPI0020170988|nr:sugar ABC transporter permease [Microbacterium sp. 2FI]